METKIKVKKTSAIAVIISLVIASVLTASAGFGLLDKPDNTIADDLYNNREPQDGIITVIGIDQRALDELGPMPWTRDIMAQILFELNADPDNRPAVIGIDVIYSGYTEGDYDDALAAACEEGGNIILAEAASFKDEFVVENGTAGFKRFSIAGYDSAIPELRKVTSQGHVNAMLDTDGILRHGLLYVEPDGYGKVLSFSRQIYENYCEVTGIEPNPEPECDSNGFFMIPYTALPGDFSDGISALDILDGTVTGDQFAGKIVLIGPYAAGLADQYFTAIEHAAPMYGVEIQANMLTSFINGISVAQAPDHPQLISLFIFSFFCCLFFKDRKVIQTVAVWILITFGWLAACLLLKNAGILIHPLWIPAAVSAIFIVSVILNYLRASAEKKRITNTFQRYVDPSIISELLKEDSDSLGLGGKLRDISVLFVDIRGFTSMSEKLTPPEVVSILNKYLSLTTECIMRNHGTLDKFVGDCTMAVWNAPLNQDDYIMHSCMAALDMVKGSAALSEELMNTYGKTVSFGVGIHCGPAVVGNIGAEMRMDFTAIGDTVNTASRLESNAPPGKIYISRDVVDALKGRIIATPLKQPIILKGKADGFEIFTLDGLTEDEIRKQRMTRIIA